MTARLGKFGLLLVAHGERHNGAENDGIARLAAALAARNVADEIDVGFIKGTPGIGEALHAFAALDIIVYPLFLADGYFIRTRLAQLVADAQSLGSTRTIRVQPPLGLDPALAYLIAGKVAETARLRGFVAAETTIVLLAHGSTKDAASQIATDQLARHLDGRKRFAAVRAAYLEQAPALSDTLAQTDSPVIVVGLFAGDGLHGRGDVSRLLADHQRPYMAFAGNVGTWPEIADIVATWARGVPSENHMRA